MRHSSATYLEVLTAQQTLLQAQLLQTVNRFNEMQGIINLYRALGRGTVKFAVSIFNTKYNQEQSIRQPKHTES
jgi:outer membrane protein TolC